MSDLALRYETEQFIRCCDTVPNVNCCDCPDGMATIWEIQEDLSGMYGSGPLVIGCENFDNEKRVYHYSGPLNYPAPIGECHWSSAGTSSPVGTYMSCWINPEVPPVDPIFQWHLDCACDDLWVGDISEWGSLEDCMEYDSNCHCSNDEGAFMGSEAECEDVKDYLEGLGLTCGSCEYVQVTEGFPGSPRVVSHVAGLGGPLGCGRHYVFLDPKNGLCKDMLDSVDSSNLPTYDCNGCNTYVLVQYHALDIYGNEAPGYPCGLGAVHLCNGADVGCTECCEGWGLYYCLGYPPVLTLCPAESINPPSSDSSDCNPDVLCCEEQLEMLEAHSITAPPAPPEDSLHFSFLHTGATGYLKKESDGMYRGEVPPIKLEVNREEQTLNGRKLTMLSDEVFIGRGKIGGDILGFYIEVMA